MKKWMLMMSFLCIDVMGAESKFVELGVQTEPVVCLLLLARPEKPEEPKIVRSDSFTSNVREMSPVEQGDFEQRMIDYNVAMTEFACLHVQFMFQQALVAKDLKDYQQQLTQDEQDLIDALVADSMRIRQRLAKRKERKNRFDLMIAKTKHEKRQAIAQEI